MSTWDWIYAGLELATYMKVRKAQKDLGDLKSAAENEMLRQEMLAAMRNFIFDAFRDIQTAASHLENFPQQVYIVARTIEQRLADSGLSPDIFPSFADKAFVYKVAKSLIALIRESRDRLTKAQERQADLAVHYITEMPMLHQAIVDKSALESLQSTEDEWKSLQRSHSSKNLRTIASAFALPTFTCIGMPLVTGGFGVMLNADTPIELFLGWFLIGISMLMFAGSSILFIKMVKPNKNREGRYSELKKKRDEWKKLLSEEEERKRYIQMFGNVSSAQLKKIYRKRIEFLQPLLGPHFHKYLVFTKYEK